MIEIPPPPTVTACGACMSPLHWLWSHERQAWVALVPGPDRWTPQWHRCRPLQEPATWKHLPHRTTPSAEYLAAREALKSKSSTDETKEN